ncbi:MAG: 3-hydroxyacyl-CoA dehydrogenase NAD-binding domain-containing protein [Gemmatimonadota bacterium]
MTKFEAPRVAIIGTGQIGRGWAALIVAAGWPVAIYDADADALARAIDAISDRVLTLVKVGRADGTVAEDSLNLIRVGRSLLHTVTDADWIIEAAPEELGVKQRLLEQIEQVDRMAAVITSSASGLFPSALSARLRRPERMLVAHPLDPVELIPVVELIPGPTTDLECVENVRLWLSLLGRAPIVLRKEIEGNVLGRIQAAVWRECIHLVLDGVLDVEDADRAVSLGPALAWAAGGPHLSNHLAAGDRGVDLYISTQMATYESWWANLATWHKLERDEQIRLIKAVEKAYGGQTPELRERRDVTLARLLEAEQPPAAE